MNKINLEFYDPTKTYLFPSFEQATPEIIQTKYSAVNIPNIKCVITTDQSATMFYGIDLLPSIAQKYDININEYANDEDILIALEDIINLELNRVPSDEPTAEERIASAMEYQNLLL